MTKEEQLERIEENRTYTGKNVKHLIKDLRFSPTIADDFKFKKGDVVLIKDCISKNRPAAVIERRDDVVILIPMTSSEHELTIGSYKSRFFGEGYFTPQLLALQESKAKECFVGVLDDNKGLNQSIQKVKEFLI